MIIRFSRHAKRRAKLYHIPESVIEELLMGLGLSDGEHELIRDIPGFIYPIKLLFPLRAML